MIQSGASSGVSTFFVIQTPSHGGLQPTTYRELHHMSLWRQTCEHHLVRVSHLSPYGAEVSLLITRLACHLSALCASVITLRPRSYFGAISTRSLHRLPLHRFSLGCSCVHHLPDRLLRSRHLLGNLRYPRPFPDLSLRYGIFYNSAMRECLQPTVTPSIHVFITTNVVAGGAT